jgi:hypothetical protein
MLPDVRGIRVYKRVFFAENVATETLCGIKPYPRKIRSPTSHSTEENNVRSK